MEKDNSKIDKFIAALYASGKEMGVSKELMTQILTSSLDKLEAEINATKQYNNCHKYCMDLRKHLV